MLAQRTLGAIMSGILRIMHPDQYREALGVLEGLASVPQSAAALSQWPTVFHVISVISNRHSPLHRELQGSFAYFDLLVSVGDYTYAPLEVWPMGLQLPNGSGSICGVSGKAFLHGAAESDGARISHVFYLRKDLQEFLHVRPCSWMTQSIYRSHLGDHPSRRRIQVDKDPFCI